ncbi:hypothetical protein vseg_021545 [Gypsophila vaccaria]
MEVFSYLVAPDIFTYGIIINGLYEAGRQGEAVEVFSYHVAKGLQTNVTTYSIMIKVRCKQGLLCDATLLFKEMDDRGCSPDECTSNTIIKGFISAKNVAKALDYLDLMSSRGFVVDNNTATLFVGLLSDPNVCDTDKALLHEYFFAKNAENGHVAEGKAKE